eukprot:3923442-Rhodomonas_salina.2
MSLLSHTAGQVTNMGCPNGRLEPMTGKGCKILHVQRRAGSGWQAATAAPALSSPPALHHI